MAHQTAGAMWENGPHVGWFWCLMAWTSSFSLENLAFQPRGHSESWLLEAPDSSLNPLPFSGWSFLHTGGDSWLPWQVPAAEGSFPGWLAPSLCKLDLSPNNLRPQLINQASQAEGCPLLEVMPLLGAGGLLHLIKIFLMFNLNFIWLHLLLLLQQLSWAKEPIY